MRIIMTGTHGDYHPGQELTLDDGAAMMLVNAGIATAIKAREIETASVAPAETAARPTRPTGKKRK